MPQTATPPIYLRKYVFMLIGNSELFKGKNSDDLMTHFFYSSEQRVSLLLHCVSDNNSCGGIIYFNRGYNCSAASYQVETSYGAYC